LFMAEQPILFISIGHARNHCFNIILHHQPRVCVLAITHLEVPTCTDGTSLIDESCLWSYLLQLVTATRTIHAATMVNQCPPTQVRIMRTLSGMPRYRTFAYSNH
jgi:hypothetical protein